MQTQAQLEASVDAAIVRAEDECEAILRDLKSLRHGMSMEKIMPRLRQQTAELTKAIHEYNAYRNALDTGS